MKLSITHQSSYSRGELLLRTFFGWIYIVIPHVVVMMFVGIWANIIYMLSWWIVLFTGKYPKSWFEFMVKYMNWQLRLNASLNNLVDGSPAIGVNGTSDKVSLSVDYPATLSRGALLLRTFFGWLYIGIPHGICLMGRMFVQNFVTMLAWWVVLITGKYPDKWHAFSVGSIRWMIRINLYMMFMTDEKPPYTGQ